MVVSRILATGLIDDKIELAQSTRHVGEAVAVELHQF